MAEGPQMPFLKKAEIRGFKSLGARTVTLHFEPGLIAITGPNGSGKSNLIDAIIFCLGENSPKSLRVNRLTSLLYEGGEEAERVPSAKVTLTLDNKDRALPIDSDVVTITRELKRSGESIYYLNGKRVLRSTVFEILEVGVINPEGLNIVPQGMVTRVAELSPDEKRKLIEEIIGLSKFDEKKAEAMRQLQEADTKLQVALARMGEIKERVRSLEAERNDQLRLKQLEEELRWLKAVLASRDLLEIRRRIEQLEGSIKERAQRLADTQRRFEELMGSIAQLDAERREVLSSMMDIRDERSAELQYALAKVVQELEALKAKREELKAELEGLRASLPALERAREEKEREVRNAEGLVEEFERRLREYEEEKVEIDARLEGMERKRGELNELWGRLQLQRSRLEERLRRVEERRQGLMGRLEGLHGKRALLEERLKGLEEKSSSFLSTLEGLKRHLEELKKLEEAGSRALKELNSSLSSVEAQRRALEREVERSLEVLEKASQALIRYESQREAAWQLLPEQLAIERLQELLKEDVVEGYRGRLEELVSYPKEYERAVLAVARGWLKALVVEDLPTLLKVVEVGKRLKVRGLRIIPLSELKGVELTSPPRIEGLIGPLASIFDAPKEVRPLLDFLFGDTLLVKGIRAAYLLASRGFRCVTLAGDILEAGNRAFESCYVARMDLLASIIDEASLGAIREVVDSLRRTIERRRGDLRALKREAQRLAKDHMHHRISLEKIRTELGSMGSYIKKYSALKRAVEKRMEGCRASLTKLEAQIARLTARLNSLEGLRDDLVKKLEGLDERSVIEEQRRLEEERLSLSQRAEELSRLIHDTLSEITRRRGALEHDLKTSLEEVRARLESTRLELNEREASLREAEAKIQELEARRRGLEEERREFLEGTKQSRRIIEEYEERIRSMRHEEERLRRSLSAQEKELFTLQKELEGLREREQRRLGELTFYGYSQPLKPFDGAEVLYQELSLEYERLRNNVNLLADKSYREVFLGYKNLSLRRNQLEQERSRIVEFIESVEGEKRKVFIEAFQKIDRELRSIFTHFSPEGSAWLELEDPDDIFSSGVLLMAQFPGKIARESSLASGGEKTLLAVAFILAIQAVYPSSFYLFDEIDAHLDSVNVERLAELLKERSQRSQILVVTLKEALVARASLVYGVYMEDGISHFVRYKPGIRVVAGE